MLAKQSCFNWVYNILLTTLSTRYNETAGIEVQVFLTVPACSFSIKLSCQLTDVNLSFPHPAFPALSKS